MGIITPEMIAAYNKAGPVHKVVDLAFDGCFEHSEYDLSFLDMETMNAVLVDCLDAMPEGDEAAKLAAAARLNQIREAEGW